MDRRAVLAVAFVAALSGCAGPGVRRGAPDAGEAARIPGVPFFADDTDQCGPSTLASVLTFWRRPATPDALRDEIYLPNIGGTLPMDMLPAVEARGLAATVTEGTLDEVKAHIRAGRPVLAYLDLGVFSFTAGHYVVVTGFDDRGVYAHSGKKRDGFISYRRFRGKWDRTDRWMLVVSGPAAEEKS